MTLFAFPIKLSMDWQAVVTVDDIDQDHALATVASFISEPVLCQRGPSGEPLEIEAEANITDYMVGEPERLETAPSAPAPEDLAAGKRPGPKAGPRTKNKPLRPER